jgi:predicted metal-dependent hydrolase
VTNAVQGADATSIALANAVGFAKGGPASFNARVPLDLNFLWRSRHEPEASFVLVGDRQVPLVLVRHPLARRYVLRLRADGVARVTIPRGGTLAAAREFAGRHAGWIERQLRRAALRPAAPAHWGIGAVFLFRGALVRIEAAPEGGLGLLRFGSERLRVGDPAADLRPAIQRHLRRLAVNELPPRVQELAAQHGLHVSRVTVRNQRTRWGSCSRRGTISLNWRLIQTPDFVRDYIILHELMHLRQMNHSARFWHEVESACPDYLTAERWLKLNSRGLLGT